MTTSGSTRASSGSPRSIPLSYVVLGGVLGWLLGQGAWRAPSVSPIARSIPDFDGLTGSFLAKHNVPWGFNPSPTISSAAVALPSKVCKVSPASLAVIQEPFERDALEPLHTTKVAPNGQQLQDTTTGAELKDCNILAYDNKFHSLIGANPTVKRLAQKDYTFAHEVHPFKRFLPVSSISCFRQCIMHKTKFSLCSDHAFK